MSTDNIVDEEKILAATKLLRNGKDSMKNVKVFMFCQSRVLRNSGGLSTTSGVTTVWAA